ncbi:MAG TPA: NosD domain-containing protein [Solirubrobacterales bacterium]|nr:NosD domain-containing protein [Solirubrobacterales bacterium]
MNLRRRVALTLLTVLLTLAFPAAASAVYVVNSTGDEGDKALNGTCETNTPGECTLRAAIQESNNSVSVVDAIEFAANFNGENADTITAASDLPTITDRLNILGGNCVTEAPGGTKGPCARVLRSGGGSLFVVNANDVKIEGMSITGAANGINVINGADGFVAKHNWVGLNLKGEAAGNTTGILLGPGADKAEIGGSEPEEGNVIGGNGLVGIDLEGASEAKIVGNFLGVAPNGTTVRSNLKNIEITDSVVVEDKAENNEIGQTISAPNRSTPKCDGGCNVIGGATVTGVDLDGDPSDSNEKPATGPTTIRGNYVGLGGDGSTVVANGTFGVLAGEADDVTVGGTAEGQTNSVAGGAYGIYGENGEDFEVLSNVIGRDRSGAPTTAPSTVGIFNISNGISVPARIVANSLEMEGGIGIEHKFTGAEITNNDVWGGANVGIRTAGGSVGEGSLIAGNRIRETTSDGILIENDSNLVIGNEVKEAGDAGIFIRYVGEFPIASGTTDNQIGGGDESEENEIVFSGGPAIKIQDFEETNNEVVRNHGEGNSGLFIDLVPSQLSEPNGPNEGVKPPAFSTAIQSKAEGTAEPGALVRVFRKASSEGGELDSFLGEAAADGSGNWKLTYEAALPTGTIVAATQTNANGGTSELATATTGADPSNACPDTPAAAICAAPTPPTPPTPAPDTTAPTAKITKAPKAKSTSTTAKFKFSSNEAGSRFECKLDKGKFKKCKSPKTYKKLKVGKHVFKVRAIDKAGNVGKPAKRKFIVLG